MRSLLPCAVLAVTMLFVTPAPKAQAYLGHNRVETVYVAPAESVVTVPTSYVIPSEYIWPTTYVTPTVYAPTVYTPTVYTPTYYLSPTAYVVPTTTYAATSYVVPTTYWSTTYYVPRRWFRRGYYATTLAYAAPAVTTTAWSYPVVASAAPVVSSCCAEAPVMVAPSRPSGSASAAPSYSGNGRRPQVVDSVPQNEPEPGLSRQATTPPQNPEPAPSTNLPVPSEAAPDPGIAPPTAPGASNTTAPASGTLVASETTRRNVQKPRSYDPELRPASVSRGILEGKVITAESGRPESGVRVIVIDHRGRFDDRIAMTDALGRYALNLPEGDWTVRVEMPSRRTYPVSELTVSGGQITDDSGRDIPSLIIKRRVEHAQQTTESRWLDALSPSSSHLLSF